MSDINTGKKTPILSISLLASNRKATIRKCLDSLRPIMEQVESELIIVDTGCDEETHAILLEYTSQIIKFKWCNDFSKARNAGLKKAKGKWFLFIDDDEWFSDVSEIVEFFTSEDYKNYGIACYIQRNYMDYGEKRYTDAWVSRMIRIDSDTRFVSSIHEYLYPIKGECKLLHAPAKHFGYIFKSEEEKYKHSERNISLLLDMIQKERGELRWWGQLAQEYRGIREYRKLEELCEDGIKLIKRKGDWYSNKERATFYIGKILAQLCAYRYEKAEHSYEEAIKDKRNTLMCQARLYTLGAEIYYRKEDFVSCEKCCENYLQIYDQLKDDDQARFRMGAFFVEEGFEESTRNSVYSWYICCRLKEKDSRALKKYFDCFNWMGEVLIVHSVLIPVIIDAVVVMDYDEYFVKIADIMINRKGSEQEVLNVLMQKEKEVSEEEYKKLVRVFSQVEHGHYYIWYMKIRDIDFLCQERDGILTEQEDKKLQEDYQALFGCVIDIFKLDESVWNIAERYQVDLEPMFLNIKFDQWRKGIDSFCENTSLEKIEERERLLEKAAKEKNIRYEYFALKSAEARLVYGMGREDYTLLRGLFHKFIEKNLEFYGSFFKTNAFEGEMELLPLSCRLAVRLKSAFALESTENFKDTINCFKDCTGIFPSLDSSIKAYVKLYGEKKKQEEKRRAEEVKKANEEIRKLSVQIKGKVRFLMEENRVAEAADILKQLRTYVLEDVDLDNLEHEIKLRLS